MPRRKKIRFTLLLAVATLLLAPATAGATTSSAMTDQVAAAVSRIVNHQNSAADITLVKSRPEIARHVPAPDGISTFVNATGFTVANGKKAPTGAGGALIQDENCAGAIDVGVQSISILGNIIWRWIHHIEACSDNVNVTRFLTRRDQLTIADGTIEFLELVTDVQGFTPSAWTTSTRQRHLKQCFEIIGCTHWYPYVRVQLFADHTYLWWWG